MEKEEIGDGQRDLGQLVGDGIEQFPEVGDLVERPGDLAVERIGEAGDAEHDDRSEVGTLQEEDEEDRDEDDADHRKQVRDGHGSFRQVPNLFFEIFIHCKHSFPAVLPHEYRQKS